MLKSTLQFLFASVLVAGVSVLSAANSAIGVAISSGSVTVDNSVVPGNATLFDGNTIATGATSSRLQMNSGKLVVLGSESSAKVFADHIVLQKGNSEISGSYTMDANSLRISGQSARVALHGKTVEVAALGSPVLVSTSTGIQVANLLPGRALAFTPQEAGALAPATLSGCVRKVGTDYFLTDEVSNVTVQLVGGGIEKHWKHSIKVTGAPAGSTPAAGASQVLNVSNIEMVGDRCKAGAGAGAAAAGSGLSGNEVAVVAGIAVAISTGVAVALAISGGSNSPGNCVSASANCQ